MPGMTSYEGDAVDWSELVGGWVAWLFAVLWGSFRSFPDLRYGHSLSLLLDHVYSCRYPSSLLSSLLQWLSSCDCLPLRVGAGSMVVTFTMFSRSCVCCTYVAVCEFGLIYSLSRSHRMFV